MVDLRSGSTRLSLQLQLHSITIASSCNYSLKFLSLTIPGTCTFGIIPTIRLESPEKEQLFLAGGQYASRIPEIMQEAYCLTRFDYLHFRSRTREFHEFNVDAGGLGVTMRDVDGDEVNREHHWTKAIKDSFCVLFVVSLCEYALMEKDGHTEKLKAVPLHKGCKELRDFAPQAEGEQFEAYCERCEKAVRKTRQGKTRQDKTRQDKTRV
jgi:hypothetical protein